VRIALPHLLLELLASWLVPLTAKHQRARPANCRAHHQPGDQNPGPPAQQPTTVAGVVRRNCGRSGRDGGARGPGAVTIAGVLTGSQRKNLRRLGGGCPPHLRLCRPFLGRAPLPLLCGLGVAGGDGSRVLWAASPAWDLPEPVLDRRPLERGGGAGQAILRGLGADHCWFGGEWLSGLASGGPCGLPPRQRVLLAPQTSRSLLHGCVRCQSEVAVRPAPFRSAPFVGNHPTAPGVERVLGRPVHWRRRVVITSGVGGLGLHRPWHAELAVVAMRHGAHFGLGVEASCCGPPGGRGGRGVQFVDRPPGSGPQSAVGVLAGARVPEPEALLAVACFGALQPRIACFACS